MAKFIFALHQSLDGFVDHQKLGPPGPAVFRHFIEYVGHLTGFLYGTRTYEIMRYWDEEQPGWDSTDHEYAAAWRAKPKWVVSRAQPPLGPNATLLTEPAIRELKTTQPGEITVGGPDLARTLTRLGLIDEYRLYMRPIVLGEGTAFFAGARPALRFAASEQIGYDVVRLTYVPA